MAKMSEFGDRKMGRYLRFCLNEMAKPTEDFSSRTFYHGTTKIENAIEIFKNGIVAREIANPKRFLAPVQGKVYITEDPMYAGIYAIGGNMFGHDLKDPHPRYGYLFTIDGSQLSDIQPDEDSIGEMIHDLLRDPNSLRHGDLWWLLGMAKRNVSENYMRKVKEGEYAYFAKVGKKLVKLMSDDQKLQLINLGAHVAHHGNLKISKAFAVDKRRTQDVVKTNANSLWNICTEIKSAEDFERFV